MREVLLTAFGVGGATLIGSLIGFLFKNPSQKTSDVILSFAGGVMLSAAVVGLIVPSLSYNGKWGALVTAVGVVVGAFCIFIIDKLGSPYYFLKHRFSFGIFFNNIIFLFS